MHWEFTAATVALGAAGLAQVAGGLVWAATLTHRVKAIERDVEPVRSLSNQVTRVETRLETLIEQFKDLNAAVRWMREPPRVIPPT
ncbi:MAG TPA: hypothetical protein VII63_08570 [Caulobacteraceae bacterium]